MLDKYSTTTIGSETGVATTRYHKMNFFFLEFDKNSYLIDEVNTLKKIFTNAFRNE